MLTVRALCPSLRLWVLSPSSLMGSVVNPCFFFKIPQRLWNNKADFGMFGSLGLKSCKKAYMFLSRSLGL